jgi:hypothetical protein
LFAPSFGARALIATLTGVTTLFAHEILIN